VTQALPDSRSDLSADPRSRLPPAPRSHARRKSTGRRDRSLLHRLILTVAALMSVSILVVTAGGWAAYRYFDGQIDRFKIMIGGDRPPGADEGTTNYLLVGSDSRSGTGDEFSKGGAVAGERSDTTMLAHLDADGTTTLVSFPRDTLVRIPGHGRDKLNTAVTLGGPSLLIETIENLTDIKIDHYVSIDLAGFRDMTDAIGGVTVCVKPLPGGSDANLHDRMSQWRGHVGENRLGGDAALAFVRQRYGLPEGDFDRIRRQQQFISAVLERATGTGVLANPVALESLLSAATAALTVDDGTDIADLRALATRLRSLSADRVRFETIPVRPPSEAEGADALGQLRPWGSVQIYEPERLDAFLDPLRGRGRRGDAPDAGSGPPDAPVSPGPSVAPGPSGSPTRDPLDLSAVRVDVYNATGRGGLAGDTAVALAEAGFRVGQAVNWPGGRVRTSQVRYGPERLAAARIVAAAAPDAELVEDATLGGGVSLVLGRSFDGLDRGAVPGSGGGASPSPGHAAPGGSPTPEPPSAPASVTAAELVAGCTY
jgi:LCP family protein required for cell wall assembly